jgi:hypothetical protein
MYVLDHALLEVDLSVKKEGGGSADKQLLSAYVEIFVLAIFFFETEAKDLPHSIH